ncbi:cytochrome c oxidase assembly protein [Nocardia elegans]|uniref:cytochrome c oxidase assembly protein n=1 Tax=Nocardia elegans TaxID=300029 RepID=UPI00189376DF|nr:cytochrome c oxidase assembly protein [Nocardia elegans]MBF6244706.1 cytochrome c oxidase assembly protein [Nocardia elegans]
MDTPLTVQSVIEEWRWDTSTIVVTAGLGLGYGLARRRADRRGSTESAGRSWAFGAVGLGVWLLTGVSVIGVYSGTLFWMRALQILLLLYVVPFGLATGRPLTVVRDSLGAAGRARMERVLASAPARVVTYPLISSIAILATPWLLILTPWYEAVLRHGVVDALTRMLLVAVGFLYFYSRLQTDPVPHRYSQALSLLITVFESLADGVLGLVLWFGPLVAVDYYTEVGRTWGPDLRMDQIIGAGIIWVLGDVLGLPYLLTLMRSWAADERRNAAKMDAELDAAEELSAPPADADAQTSPAPAAATASAEAPVQSGLWWENDPVLRDRFRR